MSFVKFRQLIRVFVLILFPFAALAQTPKDSGNKWSAAIEAFEAGDRQTSPPKGGVVFVGSSSFKHWPRMAEDFSEIPVINRGFGGSKIADSVFFADRIVIPYEPKVVVLYAGGNDLRAGQEPDQLLANYQAFDERVRTALPKATIVHVSLNPFVKLMDKDDKIREVNRRLEAYVKSQPNMIFIDSYSRLLGEDGRPRPEFMWKDGLHLNEQGYGEWKAILKPVILQAYADASSR